MQNLDAKEKIQKLKKKKKKHKKKKKKNEFEIKKELEQLITNGKRSGNTDMQEKVNNCVTEESAVKVVQEFEETIKNKKNDAFL